MKRIVIKFEYQCFPLWIYENDTFIDNDIEFSYVGFNNELQKENFVKRVCDAVDELKVKLKKDYVVDFSKEKLIANL